MGGRFPNFFVGKNFKTYFSSPRAFDPTGMPGGARRQPL
jgi:hypothetical protein